LLGIKRKIRACSVADWTATMIGQKMPDGKVIQPHKTPIRLEIVVTSKEEIP
jgi:hypothetical protein